MRSNRSKSKRTSSVRRSPAWAAILIATAITVMLGLTINYKAYSRMRRELTENDQLSQRLEALKDENLQLQDEIHELRTNPKVIERQAAKLGIDLGIRKVPVPAN
ncbi:MAG: hypothetical protein IT172_06675 [Acidobacteria bacterium]|nr:hypothetical protein [Acidobacteriota bacterium]